MRNRGERLARGWIVGGVATGIAAVSHTLAGGYRPDALGLTVALVFSGMLGTLAIGRRPSLPRLAIAVAGSQLAFHLMFAMLTSGGAPQAEDLTAMPGMHMGTVASVPPAVSTAMSNHLADPGMWVAHAIAGLLTIVFLRRAETALWGMLRRLVVRLLRRPAVAPVAHPVSPAAPAARVLRPGRHVAALPQRGPPLLAY